MKAKWPLDLDITPEQIRAKVDELLARTGEWDAWETVVLQTMRDHVDGLVAVADGLRAGDTPPEGRMREVALALGTAILPGMLHESRDEDAAISAAACVTENIEHAFDMAGDVVEGLRRSNVPPLAAFVTDPDAFLADAADAVLAAMDPARRDALIAEADALAAVRDADDGMLDEDRDDLAATGRALRAKRWNPREARETNGAERAEQRVRRAIDAAIAEYGVPERLKPRPFKDDGGGLTYNWGAGLPTPDEPQKVDDERRAMLPNGFIKVSLAIDSVGDLPAREVSRLVSEVQRIVLIAGRDVEIDGFGAPMHAPPPWCLAAALPLARLIRHDIEAGENPRYAEASGAIVEVDGVGIGANGVAILKSRPLLQGTSIHYHADLPETVKAALRGRVGVPAASIIAHPALEDDRITISALTFHDDGSVELTLDCPVERVVPLPEGVELESDPIEAWSGYGRRLLVDQFYGPINERLREQGRQEQAKVLTAQEMAAQAIANARKKK